MSVLAIAAIVLAAVVIAVTIANTRTYTRTVRKPGYLVGGPETRIDDREPRA